MGKVAKSNLFILLFSVFIIVFWASYNTIWLGDDYYYQFIFESNQTPLGMDNPQPIHSVQDIFISQYNHYFNYNGRTAAHIIVQLFCGLLGHTWFALCNGAVYLIFIMSLVFLVKGNLQSLRTWLSVTILVFLSFMTKITPSCQIGYIWMGVLNIWFIWIFIYGTSHKWWSLLLYVAGAFICGNSHEAYSIGISIAIIVYWLSHFNNFGVRRYFLAIGYGLGTLMLCLSPATRERASGVGGETFQSLFFLIFSLRAVYILIAVVIYQLVRRRITLKKLYTTYAFYWNVLLACLAFNVLIGVFCNRQLFGAELMSVILILKIIPNYAFNNFWMSFLGLCALLIIYFNIERVHLLKEQEHRIYKDYLLSENGNVYQNTWEPGLKDGWASYFWENGFHTRSFVRMMRRKYPKKPSLRIIPEYLQGKDSVELGNEVYHFKYKPGKLLLIQSTKHPQRFLVKRKFFGIFPYQLREMDFTTPLYETPYWKAIIYDELSPIIYNVEVIVE